MNTSAEAVESIHWVPVLAEIPGQKETDPGEKCVETLYRKSSNTSFCLIFTKFALCQKKRINTL